MFTGLVESLATVVDVRDDANGRKLTVTTSDLAGELTLGESIAINGCCLTVVHFTEESATFEAGPETLAKTNLGELLAGSRVNLERALRVDGRLGGHLVQGHVDGVGTVERRETQGEWETIWFNVGALARQMVPKGSVTVDGVSLTLVEVTETSFSVALIPHTLAATTLGSHRPVGARVNIETDILGKYVLKLLGQFAGGLSLETLRSAGMAP
ncbi:Riboflavin synthase [Planctomycetes bacterium Pan216]|uniref:Riboflavin synthase n=1 Tax=Kolteria novifilia TaxID=2527975 RepID=A0A518BAD4_9BACT|nr:Riboflavin synthase [Planctomycetes bacterium Pan216]